ncbi:MAG: FGGY-family carbohydrate kinase, partial [Proteobacteria bacterium]|nr:FGGY-family carbohydrate kinase [Pseudomonadota bacterium]
GVFDAAGRPLARATQPFAINRPATDHAEHGSDEIWRAVCAAARAARADAQVASARVAGLAFDATCSLALFDAAGRPATVSIGGEDRWNVVMWADHRAVAEAQEITATRHRVLDYVGGVMSPEMELPKLLWLKRHLPRAWARYGLALDLADFLLWRATGRLAVSACTVTCKWTYLNHEDRGWQTDFLAEIGLADLVEHARLPPRASPIGTVAGPLTADAASELGLGTDCIVGVGLIDAHAGGLGVLGSAEPESLNGRLAMIAGTSTCHMAVSPEPRPIAGIWGPYYGAMSPGLWLNEGGQSATGALLDHILDWHGEGRALGTDRHDRVSARVVELVAAAGPAMVEPLHVLPDFHGNRSPLADLTARGAIHGLSLDHSFDSLARLYYATAIGIALGTRHIVDAMNGAGYAIRHLHLTGGHAGNPLLVGLYADATGCDVVLPEEADGVLLGTATVAAAGSGLYASLADAGRAMVRSGRQVRPDPASREFFDRRYRAFLSLHEQRRVLVAVAAGADD